MRKVIECTPNWEIKDKMNLTSAGTLQELADSGDVIYVDAAAIVEVIDNETGEIKTTSALRTTDKQYYVGISATALDQVRDIVEYLTDRIGDSKSELTAEDLVRIKSIKKKSKGGKYFIVLSIG